MRTLAKAWVLVLTTAVMASVLAAPALAEDPSGVAKPSGGTTGKGPGVAPASLPVGIDIGEPSDGPLTRIVVIGIVAVVGGIGAAIAVFTDRSWALAVMLFSTAFLVGYLRATSMPRPWASGTRLVSPKPRHFPARSV